MFYLTNFPADRFKSLFIPAKDRKFASNAIKRNYEEY